MLNYITFKNNEEFVEWQENIQKADFEADVEIINASPINKAGIDIEHYDGTEYGKLGPNIGLFVLYDLN
jgi:hypothetical protein